MPVSYLNHWSWWYKSVFNCIVFVLVPRCTKISVTQMTTILARLYSNFQLSKTSANKFFMWHSKNTKQLAWNNFVDAPNWHWIAYIELTCRQETAHSCYCSKRSHRYTTRRILTPELQPISSASNVSRSRLPKQSLRNVAGITFTRRSGGLNE